MSGFSKSIFLVGEREEILIGRQNGIATDTILMTHHHVILETDGAYFVDLYRMGGFCEIK